MDSIHYISQRRLSRLVVITLCSLGVIFLLTHNFKNNQIPHLAQQLLLRTSTYFAQQQQEQQQNLGDVVEIAKIYGSQTQEKLGYNVKLDRNGTYLISSSTNYIKGNDFVGNLRVYKRNENSGKSYTELKMFSPDSMNNQYGKSADIDPLARWIAVGSPGNLCSGPGSVYFYKINGNSVAFQKKISGDTFQCFGAAVAISNDGYDPNPGNISPDDDCNDDINDDRYRPEPVIPPTPSPTKRGTRTPTKQPTRSPTKRPTPSPNNDDCNDDINDDRYRPPSGGPPIPTGDDCNDDINDDRYLPPGGSGGEDDCNDDINDNRYVPPVPPRIMDDNPSRENNHTIMDDDHNEADMQLYQDGTSTDVEQDIENLYLAVGAPGLKDAMVNAPYVRVYKYSGSSWNTFGNDISGTARTSFGASVAIDHTGQYVVVGAPDSQMGNDQRQTAAYVYLYNSNSRDWTMVGTPIVFGSLASYQSRCGFSVDITSLTSQVDNQITVTPYIVVGCQYDKIVNAYSFERGSGWRKYGGTVFGTASGFGYSVSISGKADSILVGSPYSSPGGSAILYKLVDDDWQKDSTLTGTNGQEFGSSVSLGRDGGSFGVGSPNYNSNKGMATVYEDKV